jgi:DNA-binding transcriptional MerR regulator
MLLKIGELAKRTGLTVRTLHHYDAIGLLAPSGRSDNGYRLYNAADMARLYQVLALARMGLPLAEIGEVLGDTSTDLAQIIARQIATLDTDIEQGIALRSRLQSLQSQFENGSAPALSECLKTMELMSIYDKYFSKEELAMFRERKQANPDAVATAQQDWLALITAMRAHLEQGSAPGHPAVQELAQRWQDLAAAFTNNDPVISAKVAAMYQNEDTVRSYTGIDAALFAYVRAATLTLKEQE